MREFQKTWRNFAENFRCNMKQIRAGDVNWLYHEMSKRGRSCNFFGTIEAVYALLDDPTFIEIAYNEQPPSDDGQKGA